MRGLLIFISFFYFINSAVSQQCVSTVSKIQSTICDTPRNLHFSNIGCQNLRLNWMGNKDQTYIVQATGTNEYGTFEINAQNYNCDDKGNCSVSIAVKSGEKVNWSVQSVCNIQNAIIYSPFVKGGEIEIPSCNAATASASNMINTETIILYPNPSNGYVTLQYYSHYAEILHLKITDINGKQVYESTRDVVIGNNTFTLNLSSLASGTYFLETHENNLQSKTKFVIVRN